MLDDRRGEMRAQNTRALGVVEVDIEPSLPPRRI